MEQILQGNLHSGDAFVSPPKLRSNWVSVSVRAAGD